MDFDIAAISAGLVGCASAIGVSCMLENYRAAKARQRVEAEARRELNGLIERGVLTAHEKEPYKPDGWMQCHCGECFGCFKSAPSYRPLQWNEVAPETPNDFQNEHSRVCMKVHTQRALECIANGDVDEARVRAKLATQYGRLLLSKEAAHYVV